MSGATIGGIVAAIIVAAAACSTIWVMHDALRRGMPRRKALTWAALQWIEFPVFLWLYRRIRPTGRRRPPAGDPVRWQGDL